jgi:hypothetical protein
LAVKRRADRLIAKNGLEFEHIDGKTDPMEVLTKQRCGARAHSSACVEGVYCARSSGRARLQ